MSTKRLAVIVSVATLAAAPSAAAHPATPAPESIEIQFDCKRNPIAILVGGELMFARVPDPTCPEGFKSGWDIKTTRPGG